jgi:hypothetical protein
MIHKHPEKHPAETHPEKHPAAEKPPPEAVQLPAEPPPVPTQLPAPEVRYERPPPKEGMVRVKMPKLTNEVNHGTTSYPVDNDGIVDLPPEAAEHVLRQGGAVLVEPLAATAEGTMKIKHTSDPNTTLGYGQDLYAPDSNGELTIPISIFSDVESHGFIPSV